MAEAARKIKTFVFSKIALEMLFSFEACIRGMRVTVGMVVGQIGAGHSVDEVLADYPYLEREDIMQALRYAA
ncbi:MAG: DUF433 domain-containing protein [Acidithiobacillus sp.]